MPILLKTWAAMISKVDVAIIPEFFLIGKKCRIQNPKKKDQNEFATLIS